MYVRWQSRNRRKPQFGRYGKPIHEHRRYRERIFTRAGTNEQDRHWRAILVENVRVDGKPTQMHIAYLAGFTESAVAIPAQQRFLWERIEKRFKRLGNRISPKDRKRIEAVLIAKIGKPPTKAQRAALDRKRERLLTGMR